MPVRKAVVVGINAYDPKRWTPLECCAFDALAMAELLESELYNFEVDLLVDGDATMPAIFRSVMNCRAANPDVLLFYFAGHGAETALGTFLVTVDNQEFSEGIELNKIVEAVSGPAGSPWEAVVFLDCCHAGSAYINPKSQSASRVSYLTHGEIARSFSGLAESRAVLAACGPHELVQESRALGHGIFTNYLLDGLRGAAADHEGKLSVLSLHLFIARPFAQMTGGRETVFRGDVHGSLILAEGLPPRLAPPLEEDVAVRLDNEARENVDRYSRLINKFSPEEWRDTGFEQAYRALTPVVEWFNRHLARSPELAHRAVFAQAYDSMVSRRQQLGTIEPGLRTEEGIFVHPPLGSGGYGEVWEVRSADGNVTPTSSTTRMNFAISRKSNDSVLDSKRCECSNTIALLRSRATVSVLSDSLWNSSTARTSATCSQARSF